MPPSGGPVMVKTTKDAPETETEEEAARAMEAMKLEKHKRGRGFETLLETNNCNIQIKL